MTKEVLTQFMMGRYMVLHEEHTIEIVSTLTPKELVCQLEEITTPFPPRGFSFRWDSSAPLIGRVDEKSLFLGKNGLTFGCGRVLRGTISECCEGSVIRGNFVRWNPVFDVLSCICVLVLLLSALQVAFNKEIGLAWFGILGFLCIFIVMHYLFRKMGKHHEKYIISQLCEVA